MAYSPEKTDQIKRNLIEIEDDLTRMLAAVHDALIKINSVIDDESAKRFDDEIAKRFFEEEYKHFELFF